MKRTLLLFICLLISTLALRGQTFSVSVANGFGDGNYSAGDTVHVWADIAGNQVFGDWSGYGVNDPEEWHTYFVMPASNVTLTATNRTITPIVPTLQQIMGRDTIKNVYTYFPPNYKAVVYFLHGSNGSAWGWTYFCENVHLLKHIAADTFAVVITEADEVTFNTDFNGDGAQRWSSDTLDADYENIQAITDTLISRGIMQASDRKIALGMSNGGTFAFSLATRLNFDAIVAFCAQGLQDVVSDLTIPSMWCMAKNDGHPSVGPVANANALAYHDTLLMRSICSDYRLNANQPLYPARFLRVNGITANEAQNVFNELNNNGWLSPTNYLTASPDVISHDMQVINPGNYPVFFGLSSLQQTDIMNTIDATYSDHQMYNDMDTKVIQFLNDPCTNAVVGIPEMSGAEPKRILVYPNPSHEQFHVEVSGATIRSITVYNGLGEKVYESKARQFSLESFPQGIYHLMVTTDKGSFQEKILKI